MEAVKRGGGTWAGGDGARVGAGDVRSGAWTGTTVGAMKRGGGTWAGGDGTGVGAGDVRSEAWTGTAVGAMRRGGGTWTGGAGAWTGGEGAATTVGEDWTREERSSVAGDFKGELIRNPRRKPDLEEAATALTG